MGVSPSAGSFTPWRVQLLGGLRADRGGRAASFRTRKTAGLLAFLAFYRGKTLSKELLVEAFWQESNSDSGRHSLRMALTSLRTSLRSPGWVPEEHLIVDRHTVQLSEQAVVTDVAEFLDQIDRSRQASDRETTLKTLSAAFELYQGPLLPGYGDDWILPQALELEESFAYVARRLIEVAAQSDLHYATEVGRRALALCYSREDIHVALMRAYSSHGQHSRSVSQFEELEQMLDNLWGELPGEDARRILAGIPRTESSATDVSDPLLTIATQDDRAPLFGRGDLIEELVRILSPDNEGPRLVTLVGLGGSGKTRLARRLATHLSGAYAGAVWFIPLVGVESRVQMQESMLRTFQPRPQRNADVIEVIRGLIRDQRAFFVLDNLDQLIEDSHEFLEVLLSSCPNLRILTTSRLPIGHVRERVISVPPLSIPDDHWDLSSLRNSPSVQILVENAQRVRPGFDVTSENAESVAQLCRRLEGMPLAIEIAATKLAFRTPAQVLATLAERLSLSTDQPDVPERHRHLDTVISWSIELLSDEERAAFLALSVCRGGFGLELAKELVGDHCETYLSSLCRCSLVTWRELTNEIRFEMLETVREMATNLLCDVPSVKLEASQRHFAFLRCLCKAPSGDVTSLSDWLDRLILESENIQCGLEAAANGVISAEEAWEVAVPLTTLIERRGRPQAWIGTFEKLIENCVEAVLPEVAAQAHMLLAKTHYALRQIRQTYEHYVLAIGAADRSDHVALQVDSRAELATPAMLLGDFSLARTYVEEAILLAESNSDPRLGAKCHTQLGWIVFDAGREGESESHFLTALGLAESSGDLALIASALTGLACAIGQDRYLDAQSVFDRAEAMHSDGHSPEHLATCMYNRAVVDYRNHQADTAFTNLGRSFHIFIENGITLGQTPLTICGNVLSASGRWLDAAMCWGRAAAARQRYGMQMFPTHRRDYDAEVAKGRLAVPTKDFEDATIRGTRITDEGLFYSIFAASPHSGGVASYNRL